MIKPLLIFLFSFFYTTYSFGATVLKVKGAKVLIENESSTLSVGDLYYLVTPEGKKIGIVRIQKTKSEKSLGKLLKGKARANLELVKREAKSKNTTTAKNEDFSTPSLKKASKKSKSKKKKKKGAKVLERMFGNKNKGLGFAVGLNSNSSNITFPTADNRKDSYSGTSLSYELIFDYQLIKKWYLRASLGQQNFESEGNNECPTGGGIKCIVDLSYINTDFWLHYYLTQNRFKMWIGAGLGILLSPSTGTTTALNPADVTTSTFYQVGMGANFSVNQKWYIPFWVEYGLFPSSDTVSMNSISGYLGIVYRL